MPQYRLYGLTVASDFALPAPAAEDRDPDVIVESAPSAATFPDSETGEELARTRAGAASYVIARVADGFLITFPGLCDALVDGSLRHVRLVPASEEQREMSHVLFAGNVLASILTLSGACVLHASAVEVDGRAIAFVGPPGMGKSTLAAVMCASGGRLLTDDVLRLVDEEGELVCESGSTEIRLRPAAASLAHEVRGDHSVQVDGRTTVRVDEGAGNAPLAGIVFPRPSRSATAFSATRLRPADALMELTRYPRILGWSSHAVLERSFRWNSRIARTSPAYGATVPWGPPFAADLAPAIASLFSGDR